jgi:hypothetical protein
MFASCDCARRSRLSSVFSFNSRTLLPIRATTSSWFAIDFVGTPFAIALTEG